MCETCFFVFVGQSVAMVTTILPNLIVQITSTEFKQLMSNLVSITTYECGYKKHPL